MSGNGDHWIWFDECSNFTHLQWLALADRPIDPNCRIYDINGYFPIDLTKATSIHEVAEEVRKVLVGPKTAEIILAAHPDYALEIYEELKADPVKPIQSRGPQPSRNARKRWK